MRVRRTAGVCLLIGTLLVGANACQAESDAEAVFRSGIFAGPELEAVLAEHRAEQPRWWALEAGAGFMALLGLVMVTGTPGPAVKPQARSRRGCHPEDSHSVAAAATNQMGPEIRREERRPTRPALQPRCHRPDSGA